jgi:probable HAF family extracellular repeat protein
MSRIRFGVWAAMALTLVAVAEGQSYTVTDLGVLPGGTYSKPGAINNHGAVVGYSDLSGGGQHAFLWTPDRTLEYFLSTRTATHMESMIPERWWEGLICMASERTRFSGRRLVE